MVDVVVVVAEGVGACLNICCHREGGVAVGSWLNAGWSSSELVSLSMPGETDAATLTLFLSLWHSRFGVAPLNKMPCDCNHVLALALSKEFNCSLEPCWEAYLSWLKMGIAVPFSSMFELF